MVHTSLTLLAKHQQLLDVYAELVQFPKKNVSEGNP
jgi:hypothetical protein